MKVANIQVQEMSLIKFKVSYSLLLAGSFKDSTTSFDSIQGGEFVDQLSDYFKKEIIACC
jgi:hypothetical protein